MTLPDRKQTEVRALLESVPPAAVPTDLAARARSRGVRLAQRRRAVALVLWAFFAAALAFALWAGVTEPWIGQPARTTPPSGW